MATSLPYAKSKKQNVKSKFSYKKTVK